MSNVELVAEQVITIDAQEAAVAQLPLDEVRLETAELDSAKPTLPELGAQLETVAQRVIKKGDGITAQARLITNQYLTGPGAILGTGVAVMTNIISPPNMAGLGFLVGTASAALCQLRADKKVAPVQITEGYGIQCLRANQTSHAFDDGEAIAFVHPRTYAKDERQTTDQARNRLHDALTVIEAAPTITKVVLPASALHEAQLPHRSSTTYNKTLLDLKLDAWVNYSYSPHEPSVVLSSQAAKYLAETLQHTQKHPLLNRTVDALTERFPLVRLQLAEAAYDNERLVPLLHTLLRRTLEGELPSAQRERGHDGDIYYDRLAPLLTQTDTTSQFDPLITQRRAANYAPVETKRLSQMTGSDEQLMADILDRLESRGYSDLQLVSIALRLAERRNNERDATDPTDAQETQTNLLIGTDPTGINSNYSKHPSDNEFMWRAIGRLTAAGLACAFMTQGVAAGMSMLNANLSKLPGIISEADVTWRVDEHGMSSAGYYTQIAYDHYDAPKVQWDGKADIKWVKPLPTAMQDPNQEHLTVSGITTSSEVSLPILDGTLLNAISAQTKDGQDIKLNVYVRSDRTHVVHVENSGVPYKVSYELTPDTNRQRVPFADRKLKITDPNWNAIDPSSLPRYKINSARNNAQYIADNFTYDASTKLQDKLNGTTTANDYLHTIYDGGRCDCVECATAAALLTERIHPGQDLLLGTGYHNEDNPGAKHSYLEASEAHAWLININGDIIDATARKIDKDSNVPIRKPAAELDAQMKDGGWSAANKVADDTAVKAATAANQNNRSPQRDLERIALAGVGMLAAAGLWREARKRTITNGALTMVRSGQWLASAAMVHPRKAASVMAWHAYGNNKTPMSVYKAEQAVPLVNNISTDTLKEIASGALRTDPQLTRRERRGTQRMAKLLLAERRRSSK